jgi:uncharacterized Zn finger protein
MEPARRVVKATTSDGQMLQRGRRYLRKGDVARVQLQMLQGWAASEIQKGVFYFYTCKV